MEENKQELKHVPLNDWHEANGGKMVPFAGFNMPVRYSGDKEEHLAVRNALGLFDVSHMGEFEVSGPEAKQLIQYVFSNDIETLQNGEIQYGCLPNETGGIVDDLLVYKIETDHYLMVVNASNIEKDFKWITKHNSFNATLKNISDNYCLFALQGPMASRLLGHLIDEEIENLNYYTFAYKNFSGFKEVFISATGYTGAGGYELLISNDQAVGLWELLIEKGEQYGIKPIGLGARDTLRLEKGYCLYGNDIDDTTSPLEAGLGWVTKFSKETLATSWLTKQKEEGLTKRLVAFKMTEKGIPRSHYNIFNESGDHLIGVVTSGTMSPSLNYGIGLAYLDKPYTKTGTELLIQVRKKMLKASVVKIPFL